MPHIHRENEYAAQYTIIIRHILHTLYKTECVMRIIILGRELLCFTTQLLFKIIITARIKYAPFQHTN